MELELVEYMQGLFTLIFVIVFIIVGLRIASKYLIFKRKVFILIGISWIGMIFGWVPDAITFLMIIFLDTPLSEEAYLIIALAFYPFFVLMYFIGFMDILDIKREKLYLIIYIIMGVLYEIIFLYLFLSPTEAVGTFESPFQVEYHLFLDIFIIIWLISVIGIGLSFVRQSLKSKEPAIKLKGKLLFTAFITIFVGALMDVLVPLTPITVVITRLILATSAIIFYMGFILPEWTKKLLLKQAE